MQPYYNFQDYTIFNYKKQLKKDSNKVGWILIFFMIAMTALSSFAVLVPLFGSMLKNPQNIAEMEATLLQDTSFLMLLSGLVSIVTFFGISIVYSLFSKSNLGNVYPLDKIGPKITYHLCALGLAVCMIANYVSNILLALFEKIGINGNVDTNYECDSAMDVILFYITVAILPALVEEFAFRGVVLNILKKYSEGLAVLVSGITFGLMHGNFAQIPFALVVGLMLGYVAVKTNSLLPGIIIHFLNNGLSVTFTLLFTNTDLSEALVNLVYTAILLIIAVSGIVSFVILSKKHKGFFKLQKSDNAINFKEKLMIVSSSPTIITFVVISLCEAVLMLTLIGV